MKKKYEHKYLAVKIEMTALEFCEKFPISNEDQDEHAKEMAEAIIGESIEREQDKLNEILNGKLFS